MNNPVVVISGATGATGASAARAFARQGASLALLSSNRAKLESLAEGLNLSAARLLLHTGDLTSAEDVNAAATFVHSRFGRADILLHLVGGWIGGKTLAETPASDLETMLAQHLWSTFHLAQAFVPGMVHNGWGRVIIVSSPTATHPPAKSVAYAVAKAAEEALLLTLAQEVKDSGVTANIIQVRSIDAAGAGKGTSPDQIVSAMQYLCSEPAAQINGARLPLF